jgi:hypothetical protein
VAGELTSSRHAASPRCVIKPAGGSGMLSRLHLRPDIDTCILSTGADDGGKRRMSRPLIPIRDIRLFLTETTTSPRCLSPACQGNTDMSVRPFRTSQSDIAL